MSAVEPLYTLDQAKRMLAEPLKNLSYQQTRLGSFVRDYLAWKQMSRAAERTLDSYERVLARLCTQLPDCEPREIGPEQIMLLLQSYPEGSWRRARAALNGFFKWAITWDKCDRNPCDRLPTMRQESTKVYDIFDTVERAKLLHAVADSPLPQRDLLAVLCVQELGIRKSEALGIRLRDFDLATRVVLVTGKGNKERVVPYGDELFAALLDFLHTPIPKARLHDVAGVYLAAREPRPTDYLFFPSGATGRHGSRVPQLLWTDPVRPMGQTSMHRWWGKRVDEAGIVYRSLHMNRHTVATELVEAEVDSFTVRDWLGHADTRTTEVYVHNARGRLRKASQRLLDARREAE